MRTIKAIVAYKGTRYSGWQIQANARTIQQVITDAIARRLPGEVHLLGASRTDAGVHAQGQVVAIRLANRIPVDKFCEVMNKVLPEDICFVEAEEAGEDFHPIGQAISKIYHYNIYNASVRSPFKTDFYWEIIKPLDIEAMKHAAELLCGIHDYSAFCAVGSNAKTRIRTVHAIDIKVTNESDIRLTFYGNGFLYNMIRIMTAVLVRVGRGQLSPEEARRILDLKDRLKAPWTAPAHGLCLHKIFYSEAEEIEYFQGSKKI